MGGPDDNSNIFECSAEQHAELHLHLYLTHGHLADWLAYHALSGQIGKEDIQKGKSRLGALHPNVRSEMANRKRSATLKGRPHNITHVERKVKSADRQRVLDDKQVIEMKHLRQEGWKLDKLADKYNTKSTTIHRYLKNKVRGAKNGNVSYSKQRNW